MSNDPYRFDTNVDNDIFEETDTSDRSVTGRPHKHTIDGSICPTCRRIHDFGSMDLTPSQQEDLLSALDKIPGKIANEYLDAHDHHTHIPSYVAYEYLHLNHECRKAGRDLPAIGAMVEVLDQLTDGKATKMWRIREIERELMVAHTGLKAMNNTLESARADLDADKFKENDKKLQTHWQAIHTLEFMCDLMTDRITSLIKSYRGLCKQTDVEPKEEVIASGSLPEESQDEIAETMLKKIRLAAAKVFVD